MRTTIDIDEQLLLYAKHQAASQNIPLKNILEDALRSLFARQQLPHEPMQLQTCSGNGLKAGVNLENNRSLNDIMGDC